MKKSICILLAVSAAIMVSACSEKNDNTEIQQQSEFSVITSSETVLESSKERSQPVSYPSDTEEIDAENLRFKSKSGKYTAVFPKSFSAMDTSLKTKDGIYLTTADGKAGLLLDVIESKDITAEALAKYLEDQYEGTKAEIKDENTVIFQGTSTDKKKNKAVTFLKAIITENGYIEAVITCHETDTAKYSQLIDKVEITLPSDSDS